MGLIFGSLPYVIRLKPLKIFGIGEMLGLGISLILVPALDVYISSERIAEIYAHGSQPFILFISSVIAGGAMIVPGISGSLVYLLFDQYSLVVHSVNNLDLFPLILIVFGGILGIIVFAKIIYQAFDRWPSKTHSIIIGLLVGSLFILFKGFPPSIQGIMLGIGFFIAGAILSASIYHRRT
jgi:putative membrane protein